MSYPSESAAPTSASQPRLLDQVRDRIRRKGYSIRTEKSYAHWIKRLILFHDKRHPKDMGAAEVAVVLGRVDGTAMRLMECARPAIPACAPS